MAFVLDASVMLAWLLPDEVTDGTDSPVQRLENESARVPPIWMLEVSNALLSAMKRKRITQNEFARYIDDLTILPIETDASMDFAQVIELAKRHGLTTYDATYLELALRAGLPLATLDVELRRACKSLKVPVLP